MKESNPRPAFFTRREGQLSPWAGESRFFGRAEYIRNAPGRCGIRRVPRREGASRCPEACRSGREGDRSGRYSILSVTRLVQRRGWHTPGVGICRAGCSTRKDRNSYYGSFARLFRDRNDRESGSLRCPVRSTFARGGRFRKPRRFSKEHHDVSGRIPLENFAKVIVEFRMILRGSVRAEIDRARVRQVEFFSRRGGRQVLQKRLIKRRRFQQEKVFRIMFLGVFDFRLVPRNVIVDLRNAARAMRAPRRTLDRGQAAHRQKEIPDVRADLPVVNDVTLRLADRPNRFLEIPSVRDVFKVGTPEFVGVFFLRRFVVNQDRLKFFGVEPVDQPGGQT